MNLLFSLGLSFNLPFGIDWSLLSTINWSLAMIPLISGIIGYITNWFGIKMLFYPMDFWGVRVPGLKSLSRFLPRKIQQIPGVAEGRVGWQGIIPSRAGKMGSIAVDKGIAKLGSEREFYEEFDPDKLAQHILDTAEDDVRDITEKAVRETYPELWENAPRQVRETIHVRVQAQLPEIIDELTDDLGENITDMLDVKLMVINHIKENPELVNRIFLECGDRELKFIINSGFLIGVPLGVLTIPMFVYIDQWWILPVAGILVGYLTNWIALKIIFNPLHEHRIGPLRLQGLFMKRQPEVSETYASIIAEDIITMVNVGENIMHGRQSDRTRLLIRNAMRPIVDDTVGALASAVRAAGGREGYENLRETAADEGVEYAMTALKDTEFSRSRSKAIRTLLYSRMLELPVDDYAEMLHTAFEEDEWLLILIGAVLGFIAGWLQLLVVTAL
jgi:uncharacterized membrane protein YheB (UPF0754 family)